MKSVNILYINIIFSAVNWKDNPAGRCMDIYNIVFHFSGCRIGGRARCSFSEDCWCWSAAGCSAVSRDDGWDHQ